MSPRKSVAPEKPTAPPAKKPETPLVDKPVSARVEKGTKTIHTIGASLIDKLCQVQDAVGLLPKDGWNDHHNYHYTTEGAVLDCVRHELASRNIWLQPQVDAWHLLDPVGKMVPAIVEMTFTWRDGDSGEEWAVPWVGCGSDPTDKHIFKAQTGALKFFLLKTFLIPTGDDPETGDDKRFEGKTRKQEAAAQAGSDAVAAAGGNFVTDVRSKKVGAKKDKVKYDVTLTSGKADTWSRTMALKAQKLMREKTAVVVVTNKTQWGDELESIEGAAMGTAGPDKPKPEPERKPVPTEREAQEEVDRMKQDGRLKSGREVETSTGHGMDVSTGEVTREPAGEQELRDVGREAFGITREPDEPEPGHPAASQPSLEEKPLEEDDIPF